MPWFVEHFSEQILNELRREMTGEQFSFLLASELERLEAQGLNLLTTNRAKSLGHGLFELRIRRDPDVLVRIFFTLVHPSRLVIVGGYNKKRDSSEIKQRREIKAARKIIDEIQGRS